MADGIYYDGSNKQLKFTVSGSNVLTLASGSGLNFANGITASTITISSSNSGSVFNITAKDSNSTSKLVFPISETASYFMESMSGSQVGDFRAGLSASVAGGLNGIQEFMHVYAGGLFNIKKVSLICNTSESFSVDDSGSVSVGYTGSNKGFIYIKKPQNTIGINTLSPSVDFDVNANSIISGNVYITGSLSVGFNSAAYVPSAGRNSLQVSGSVFPSGSGVHSLGTGSYLWNDVWATNGTIRTSDRDLKTDIDSSDLGIDFIKSLKPVSYKFISGSSGRTHYGLISQDVENVLISMNKSGNDFAGFIKYKNQISVTKEKIDYITSSDGEVVGHTSSYLALEDDKTKEFNYALRYGEFISPMIKAIQDLSDKLEKLESKLSSSN